LENFLPILTSILVQPPAPPLTNCNQKIIYLNPQKITRMKKLLLPLITVCAALLFGCKKDSSSTGDPTSVSSKDPVALFRSLKIWHGTRQAGTAPSPTGGINAPSVTPGEDVQALNGQFAIIKPHVLNGSVAGYYVGIEGAGEYFNLDYSKPRNTGRPSGRMPRNFLQRPMDADSSIVVVIPPNLQVPDTFCITYCPYDSLGNIGLPVTTCIYVSQLGGDASNSWMAGTWSVLSDVYDNGAYRATLIFNRWVEDESKHYCYDDLQGNSYITSFFDSSNAWAYTDLHLSDSIYRYAADISLGSNGGMAYIDSSLSKRLDGMNSTCAAPVTITSPETYHVNGGWSATGNSLTLVYLFDEFGTEDYSATTYTVVRPDNNTMVLYIDGSNEWVTLKRM